MWHYISYQLPNWCYQFTFTEWLVIGVVLWVII